MAVESGEQPFVTWSRVWRRFLQEHASRISEIKYTLFLFRKNRLAVLGLGLILGVIAIALLAPYLAIDHPDLAVINGEIQQRWGIYAGQEFLPPSLGHPFGTDNFGVDWYSKVLYGAGVSLQVGL